MSFANLLQYVFFLLAVLLVQPGGSYLVRVLAGKSSFLNWLLRPLERVFYRLARVDPQRAMSWQQSASSFVFLVPRASQTQCLNICWVCDEERFGRLVGLVQ